jgi:alcohol dehydrogenase class IV
VIYDPELTYGLPAGITVTSALNAMAHAAEALYARDRNPISSLMAAEGLRALIAALPVLRETPADSEGRAGALYGAWLCGSVLGSVGMALHHKLCHVLGGTFDLPHAETHAVILPHAVAFNEAAVPDLLRPLARALNWAWPIRSTMWNSISLWHAPATGDVAGDVDLPCCEKRAQCVRDPVQRNLGADTQEQESGQTCQHSGAGLTKKADQMIR